MWTNTKPTPMMPVIAMTYFLPTAVEYTSRRNGLRFRAFGAVELTGPRVTTCAIRKTVLPTRRPTAICDARR